MGRGAQRGWRMAEKLQSMSTILGDDPLKLRILNLYYVDGLTQGEIGRHVGLDQQEVSRHIRKSLAKLRRFGNRHGHVPLDLRPSEIIYA